MLPLKATTSDVHTEITRRTLEQALTRAALRVDGIMDMRLRRRRVTVHAATLRRLPGDLRDRVTANTAAVLTELDLQARPRLVVDVHNRRPPRGDV